MEDVIAWAEEVGLEPAARSSDDLVHVADAEVAFTIASLHDVYPVQVTTRWYERALIAAFEDVEDARRFLVMELGALLRARASRPALAADELPPGFVIEEAPTALWLSWLTGSAEFPSGTRARERATTFSRVERADLESIRASYLQAEGKPLLQLAG